MTSKPSQHHDDFVSLNVKASVLQKMLSGESLHMSDIHCTCTHSKRILQKLLIQAVVGSDNS